MANTVTLRTIVDVLPPDDDAARRAFIRHFLQGMLRLGSALLAYLEPHLYHL